MNSCQRYLPYGSICFSKIAGAPQFLGSKGESMACALRHSGVTDSGVNNNMNKET
ncbi:MAG: hypothetical protein P8X74_12110 [Reinekea sp.]